jgi:hypothetical protein
MQPALDMQPEPEVEPGFTVGGPGPVGRAEPRASGTKGSTKIIEVSAWDDMLIAPGSWAHRAGLAPTGGLPAAGPRGTVSEGVPPAEMGSSTPGAQLRASVEQRLADAGDRLVGEHAIDVVGDVVLREMCGTAWTGCLALTTYRVLFVPAEGGRGALLGLYLSSLHSVDMHAHLPTRDGQVHAATVHIGIKDSRALHFVLDAPMCSEVQKWSRSSQATLDDYAETRCLDPAATKKKKPPSKGRHRFKTDPADMNPQEYWSRWRRRVARVPTVSTPPIYTGREHSTTRTVEGS